MKYFLSIPILFTAFSGTFIQAQTNDSIKGKIREEYSVERLLKNSITINPASQMNARKYNITTFRLFTENSDTPNQLKQNGKGVNLWGGSPHLTGS